MPLEVLAPLVVFGIALACGLVWAMANTNPRLIENGEMAAQRFAEDHPLVGISQTWMISDDRKVAVAQTRDRASIALVKTMGSKHLTRLIGERDVRSVKADGDRIVLRLNDFTLPRVSLALSAPSDRDRITSLFGELPHRGSITTPEKVPMA